MQNMLAAIPGLGIDFTLGLGDDLDDGTDDDEFPTEITLDDESEVDNESQCNYEAYDGGSDDEQLTPEDRAAQLAGTELTQEDLAEYCLEKQIIHARLKKTDLVAKAQAKMRREQQKRDRKISMTAQDIGVGDTVFFFPESKYFSNKNRQYKLLRIPAVVWRITERGQRKKKKKAKGKGQPKTKPQRTMYHLFTLEGRLDSAQYVDRLELVTKEQRGQRAYFKQLVKLYKQSRECAKTFFTNAEWTEVSVLELCKRHSDKAQNYQNQETTKREKRVEAQVLLSEESVPQEPGVQVSQATQGEVKKVFTTFEIPGGHGVVCDKLPGDVPTGERGKSAGKKGKKTYFTQPLPESGQEEEEGLPETEPAKNKPDKHPRKRKGVNTSPQHECLQVMDIMLAQSDLGSEPAMKKSDKPDKPPRKRKRVNTSPQHEYLPVMDMLAQVAQDTPGGGAARLEEKNKKSKVRTLGGTRFESFHRMNEHV